MLDARGDTAFETELANPLLQLQGLCFEVGGSRLIESLNLTCTKGRKTILVGPNGAGKSLALRLMHGLIAPSQGRVLWQGRRLDRAARRSQAMVFQRPVMLRRSVRANLRFALGVRGLKNRQREDEALHLARLEHLAKRPARVLSVGEQQRLAIARAMLCSPEMVLLDEPTASLDPASTHAIEGLIERANEVGVTIVMVTHDAGQARRLADDLVVMSNGRIAEAGKAETLLTAPKTKAARAWLEGRLHLGDKT